MNAIYATGCNNSNQESGRSLFIPRIYKFSQSSNKLCRFFFAFLSYIMRKLIAVVVKNIAEEIYFSIKIINLINIDFIYMN